ncbi:MAG TPA: YciI family protein [Polyangiaceae bacterium]|jgi:hypothetical protein|nr:YciI family protein [Polyangiaceae bacterium]
MTDYLLMVADDESAHASESPKAMAELIEKRAAFVDGLRRGGQLRDSGRLRPSKEGRRIRLLDGRVDVQAGPFLGDGKALGAYYWVAVRDLDEAAELAAACPRLAADEVDVRPVMKGSAAVEKETKPGKLFACAVLGNAPTEEAWVNVMDRIDTETNPSHAAGFLGGLRLEAPTTGKRVQTRGERRALFDGPFLESKEVIGGLIFLRTTDMEEALRWAAATRFIVHGTLELRELWRT